MSGLFQKSVKTGGTVLGLSVAAVIIKKLAEGTPFLERLAEPVVSRMGNKHVRSVAEWGVERGPKAFIDGIDSGAGAWAVGAYPEFGGVIGKKMHNFRLNLRDVGKKWTDSIGEAIGNFAMNAEAKVR